MRYLEIISRRFGYRPKYQVLADTEADNQNPVRLSVYHIFEFTISTCLAYKNVSISYESLKLCVTSQDLFTSDII